ncbi:hypothetical protein [Pseudonocardia abyssalis]|uniref:DUF4386 family protein n=2 Tax=Pseudonocardia abyssalis TaxID=2792008 RepID=A0ABS6UMZ4_9PSEU|nr:hypothetical protein [Pseudonocardia abyssalis]MBW0133602.1 hypothetical protein [Pseudonocardia abyssalis]
MSTDPQAPPARPGPTPVRDRRTLRRVLGAVLMPIGPAAVAVIRSVYPPDAAAALAAPSTMTLVLWLGLVATFTLLPGAYTALHLLHRYVPTLALWTAAFLVPGYLAMYTLGFVDTVYAIAPAAGLTSTQAEDLVAAADTLVPPTIALLVFVLGHVVGTVLLGVAARRARLLSTPVAALMIVSQPLHVVSVVLAMPLLDLAAWGLTALGMGALALRVLRTPDDEWELPPFPRSAD